MGGSGSSKSRSSAPTPNIFFDEDEEENSDADTVKLELATCPRNQDSNVSTKRNYSSVSSSSSTNATHYVGSTVTVWLDEERTQGIDEVDGQEQTGVQSDNNEAIPFPSTSTTLYSASNWRLPADTPAELHLRVSEWVNASSPSASVEEDDDVASAERSSVPGYDCNTIDIARKLLILLNQKLSDSPVFVSTVGSVSEYEEGAHSIFEVIAKLLEADLLTEALMQIIHLIWAPIFDDLDKQNEAEASKRRQMMLTILNYSCGGKKRLDAIGLEKILTHNIFTDVTYFQWVSLVSSIRNPAKELIIFQHVETWINNALQLSLECGTPVIDLDIRIILAVIMEANVERSLYLSPEEESRHAAKAQRKIREIFFIRSYKFLRSQGFSFNQASQVSVFRIMGHYNNHQAVPPFQPVRLPLPWNHPSVPQHNQQILIESFIAQFGEQQHSRSPSSSPRESLSVSSVSSRSGPPSQQGYNSSPSLSLPSSNPQVISIPSSQGSSSNERNMRYENHYIGFTPTPSSSSSGSLSPPEKRARYGNSSSSSQSQ